MTPVVKNLLIASADQVAIDAVAAKLIGFDPMDIKCIRLGHEEGLGKGRIDEIEIVRDLDNSDVRKTNWDFVVGDNAASKVESLGSSIMAPPTDIPDIGRFAGLKDRQGSVFFIFKPAV